MIDVCRSADPPASLAKGKSHNDQDVLEALFRDFRGKCYLCETQLNHYGSMEVDHRIPVTVDKSKEFEWTNLYPLCRPFYCNQRRTRKDLPHGGWLNPGDGVEVRLLQWIDGDPTPNSPPYAVIHFKSKNPIDAPAVNTAVELDRIHNATGSDKRENARFRAEALRSAISKYHQEIVDALAELDRISSTDSPRTNTLKAELRTMLGRDAPYFMLMKSYFRQIPIAREFLPAGA
jgi:hypothetical protein